MIAFPAELMAKLEKPPEDLSDRIILRHPHPPMEVNRLAGYESGCLIGEHLSRRDASVTFGDGPVQRAQR